MKRWPSKIISNAEPRKIGPRRARPKKRRHGALPARKTLRSRRLSPQITGTPGFIESEHQPSDNVPPGGEGRAPEHGLWLKSLPHEDVRERDARRERPGTDLSRPGLSQWLLDDSENLRTAAACYDCASVVHGPWPL